MTTPNAIDQNATSQMAELLTFTWREVDVMTFEESEVSERIAGYTSKIVIGAETFEAVPALEVGDITVKALPSPEIVNVKLPVSVYPFDEIAGGEPWGEIHCLIEEVDPSDTSTRRALWAGVVSGVVANPDGDEEMVRVEIESLARVLKRATGISCEPQCVWRLGDKNCCVDLGPLKKTLTIDDVSDDGFTVSVTGLDPDLADRYWHQGYIARGAGRIKIHDYQVAGELVLARRLPAAWVGLSVMAVPGCDGKATTCESRYSNIGKFGGFGHGMRDYNPSFGFGGK